MLSQIEGINVEILADELLEGPPVEKPNTLMLGFFKNS